MISPFRHIEYWNSIEGEQMEYYLFKKYLFNVKISSRIYTVLLRISKCYYTVYDKEYGGNE